MDARHLLAAPLLAAAVAGPYLTQESATPSPAPASPNHTLEEPAVGAALSAQLAPPPGTEPADAPTAAPPVAMKGIPPFDVSQARFAGIPVADFAEVFRFDVTPEWIFTRWSRVSTVTADQSLKGFRVAMVTGARVDDVAGVATYYFGRHGALQRIAFEGRTGDTRRLTAFLTQNYGFHTEPNLGAGMYLVRWNAKPMSGLRIDYAPVVRADAPHERYWLKLEINRPDFGYEMSADFQQILGSDVETQRWLPF